MTVHQFGTFDAKNKLSHLLDLVEQGDEVIITRNGKPVARMLSSETSDVDIEQERREKGAKAIEEIRKLRERAQPLGEITIKELIEEGRRY